MKPIFVIIQEVIYNMEQAIKEIEDINRMKRAIKETKSAKLKNDYAKAIRRKINELQIYCDYKGLDIGQLLIQEKSYK